MSHRDNRFVWVGAAVTLSGNYMMTQTHIERKFDLKQNDQSSLESNHSQSQEIPLDEKLGLDNALLVEVSELGELTEEEMHLRFHLERKVERAFYEAGKALMELKDKRLYRSTHKTFEEYCKGRFGYSRDTAYLKMSAANVFDNIQKFLPTNGRQIPMPTNERQLRDLAKANLEPEVQATVWLKGVKEADGGVPSGRIVKNVVQRIMERTKAPNPYRVGEVCRFIVKDNPELRGKGGYWCIVNCVGEVSCTVTSWDGDYTVSTDHLKSMEYSDSNCQLLKEISDRITRLQKKGNLEDAAINVLRQLGSVKRPYLTPLEEDLLTFLEQKFGVDRSTVSDVTD